MTLMSSNLARGKHVRQDSPGPDTLYLVKALDPDDNVLNQCSGDVDRGVGSCFNALGDCAISPSADLGPGALWMVCLKSMKTGGRLTSELEHDGGGRAQDQVIRSK